MAVISVIVPVYNVEKYLKRCVDSILNQTFVDFELILIDDGSSDNSGAICDEYAEKDTRIKVIHKKNGGVSSARNLGIKDATGKYISFIDSDDIILPSSLEKQFNIVKNQSIDLLVCGIDHERVDYENNTKKVVSQLNRKIITLTRSEYSLMLDSVWTQNNMLSSCGKLFKTEIINKNGIHFNENLVVLEDFCFVIDYLNVANSIYSADFNSYRICDFEGKNSVLHRSKVNYISDIIFAYDKIKTFLIKNNMEVNDTFILPVLNIFNPAIESLRIQKTTCLKEKINKYKEIRKTYRIKEVKEYTKINKNKYSFFEYLFKLNGNVLGLKFLYIIQKKLLKIMNLILNLI